MNSRKFIHNNKLLLQQQWMQKNGLDITPFFFHLQIDPLFWFLFDRLLLRLFLPLDFNDQDDFNLVRIVHNVMTVWKRMQTILVDLVVANVDCQRKVAEVPEKTARSSKIFKNLHFAGSRMTVDAAQPSAVAT